MSIASMVNVALSDATMLQPRPLQEVTHQVVPEKLRLLLAAQWILKVPRQPPLKVIATYIPIEMLTLNVAVLGDSCSASIGNLISAILSLFKRVVLMRTTLRFDGSHPLAVESGYEVGVAIYRCACNQLVGRHHSLRSTVG